MKVTNPGYKKVVRLYGKDDGMAIADLIALDEEEIDTTKPLRIFHPLQTYKNMVVENFTARELLVPVFVDGRQVYFSPSVKEIQEYEKKEFASMWDEYKRLLNPHVYKVDLSDRLYDLKKRLINEHVEEKKA